MDNADRPLWPKRSGAGRTARRGQFPTTRAMRGHRSARAQTANATCVLLMALSPLVLASDDKAGETSIPEALTQTQLQESDGSQTGTASVTIPAKQGSLAGTGARADTKPASRTRMSTQIFITVSDLQRRNVTSSDEGMGADLGRFFINIDHRINSVWSTHLTTDVQWQRHRDPTDLLLRHAYVQQRLSKAQHIRYGDAPTPWIGYVARRYGFRYVNPDMTAQMRLGAPADWGVHLAGDFGQFKYAVAAVTGAGFQKPRVGKRADFEGRMTWSPGSNIEIALGTYQGTRAMDVHTSRLHTAKRWNGAITYVDEQLRFGAEVFYADNWTRVTKVSPDAARGWSSWASYQVSPSITLMSRHDHTEMSLRLNPTLEQRYTHLGVELMKTRHLRSALVGKRTSLSSASQTTKDYELGFWTQLVF